MRIRTIKPEWLDDERLVLASPEARVLSVALILLADDYGNGRANPTILAARVFPGSRDPRETLANALDALAAAGFVDLYTVDGQSYFSIRNWAKHQKVDHPGKPQVPGKPAVCESSRGSRESLAKVPESLGTDQDQEGTRKGPGEDRESTLPDTASSSVPTPRHMARFEASFAAPHDRTADVVAVISETRVSAGGAPYSIVTFGDREAVQRLAEWSSASTIGLDRLRAAMVAFWAAKGTSARLSWMVEEDPGRWLGSVPSKRGHHVRALPNSAYQTDLTDLDRILGGNNVG